MEIKTAYTPNFQPGRNGKKTIAIINHITAGSYPGCLSWMQNPVAQASAHYLITKSGQIYQLVNDTDTAWHAGTVNKPNWPLYDGTNPNRYTIGIEHEGYPQDTMPEAQYQATLWLHQQLVQRHNIPIDNNYIIGHYRIDSVNRPNCPGPNFPWKRLFEDLKKGEDENMVKYEKVADVPDWGIATINKLMSKGAIIGDETGKINLSDDMLRILVINDRMGLYGEVK